MNQTPALKILIAGIGNMGRSHALACHRHSGFDVVGLVNRSTPDLPDEIAHLPLHHDFLEALERVDCDVVSINTYSDSHAEYAIAAMEKGKHVFLEKPMATSVADAQRIVEVASRNKVKLLVGYILRHHPSWIQLIAEARALGGPFIFA